MSRRSRLFVTTQVKDWGRSPLERVPNTAPLPTRLSAELWLDASDTTTITASSGDVSQWNNKGSLGNFTQGTGALQPKTGVTTQNGLNVLDFAGDYLVAANTNEWKFLHDGTKYIVAAMVKFGASADPNAAYALFGNSSGTTASVGVRLAFEDRIGTANNAFFAGVFRGQSGVAVVNYTADGLITPNAFGVVSAIIDPSNGTANNRAELFFNAGAGNKGNAATGAVSTSNPTRALEIGRDDGGALTGSVGELIVVSGANATETNRAELRDYLNGKWGAY